MAESAIVALVIVCSQFQFFVIVTVFASHAINLIRVTVLLLVTVMCVLHVRSTGIILIFYAHAYTCTVPNPPNLHQSVYEYTISTFWKQFYNVNMV